MLRFTRTGIKVGVASEVSHGAQGARREGLVPSHGGCEFTGKDDLVSRFPITPGPVTQHRAYAPVHLVSVQKVCAHPQQVKVKDRLREKAIRPGLELAPYTLELQIKPLAVRIDRREDPQVRKS